MTRTTDAVEILQKRYVRTPEQRAMLDAELEQCEREMKEYRPKLPAAALIGWERYVLGRMTYAVSEFCEWICAHWDHLDWFYEDAEHAREIIRQDVEEMFARDNRARNEPKASHRQGSFYYPLGHDCDRAAWEKVRELWTAT